MMNSMFYLEGSKENEIMDLSMPKRIKLENAEKLTKVNQIPRAAIGVTNFAELTDFASFVDKTEMIAELFIGSPNKIVTVPKHFGKTTVVSMLKYFLTLQVGTYGFPISKLASSGQPVRNTDNYKLFIDHNLKITQNHDIMDSHFGKYPVIHVDFSSPDSVGSEKQITSFFKSVIHQAYKEHRYLMHSVKLSNEEKSKIAQWCDNQYVLSETDVNQGLVDLSQFLFQHFNRQCFILIDNYDSIMLKVISFTHHEEVLRAHHNYLVVLLSSLLESTETVKYTFITGVSSCLVSFDSSKIGQIDNHSFMNGGISRFFGFTDFEFKMLCEKFQIDSELASTARNYYRAYKTDDATELYSFWSILIFLSTKKIDNYWINSVIGYFFDSIFQVPQVSVLKLLCGEKIDLQLNNEIFDTHQQAKHSEEIAVRRLVSLSKLSKGDVTNDSFVSSIYFLFLIECGYLTVDEKKNFGIWSIMVPNKEVISGLLDLLRVYCRALPCFEFDVDECCKIFYEITMNSDDSVIRITKLTAILEILNNLFSQMYQAMELTLDRSSERIFEMIVPLLFLMAPTKYQIQPRVLSDVVYSDAPTICAIMNDCAFIISFKVKFNSKNSTLCILYELINSDYDEIFRTNEWAGVKKCFFIAMTLKVADKHSLQPFVVSVRYILKDLQTGKQIPEENSRYQNIRAMPESLTNLSIRFSKYLVVPKQVQ